MAGSITAGIMAGLAIRRQREADEKLETLRQRQALLGTVETLKHIGELPPGPVRQIAITQTLAPLGLPEDSIKAISRANDEEYATLGEMVGKLVAANPQLGVGNLQALFKSGGLKLADVITMSGKMDAAAQQKQVAGIYAEPSPAAAEIATGPESLPPGPPTPQPMIAPAMPDVALRSGPAGVALGQTAPEPFSPLTPEEQQPPVPVAVGAVTATAPRPVVAPKARRGGLDVIESELERLQTQATRVAAIRGGLSDEDKRYFDTQREALVKRQSIILDRIKEANPELRETKIGSDVVVYDPRRPEAGVYRVGPSPTPEGSQSERAATAYREAQLDPGDPRKQETARRAKLAGDIETGWRAAGASAVAAATIAATSAAKLYEPISREDATALGVPMGTRAIDVRGVVPMTTAQQNAAEAAASAKKVLGRLGDLAEKVFTTSPTDPMGRMLAIPKTQWQLFQQSNEDMVLYRDMSEGVLGKLQRAFEATGQMSDKDITRAKGLIPNLGSAVRAPDTKEVAKRKIEELNKLYDEIAARPIPGGGAPPPRGGGAPKPPTSENKPPTADEKAKARKALGLD